MGADGKPAMMHPSDYFMYYHSLMAQQQGNSSVSSTPATLASSARRDRNDGVTEGVHAGRVAHACDSLACLNAPLLAT